MSNNYKMDSIFLHQVNIIKIGTFLFILLWELGFNRNLFNAIQHNKLRDKYLPRNHSFKKFLFLLSLICTPLALLYEFLRGAVVVFAGELAEADVSDSEFGGYEGGGGVGARAVVLDVVLEPLCHPGFGGCAEFFLEGFHEGFFGHA